jgi:hypothetical protein
MTDRQRIEQLEKDVGVLARLLTSTAGGKRDLMEIVARLNPAEREIRPYNAPETREVA